MDHPNKQPSDSSGMMGRASRLKHQSSASAAELRSFIKQIKGKGPQEMLGVIAQSDLVRSTALATVLFAVLLLVFTLIPAMMAGDGNNSDAVTPVADKQGQNDNKAEAAKNKNNNVAGKKQPDGKDGKQPTAVIPKSKKDGDILDALDIGDAKSSDPTKNPLGDFDPFKNVKE